MSDIAATSDGLDIDFTREPIAGLEEHRQAALSRISNEVTYTDDDYGIDLAGELGTTGREGSLGIRASAAIMNDTRFIEARLTNQKRTQDGDTVAISLSFDVVAQDGTELSLDVRVANGEVVLIQ